MKRFPSDLYKAYIYHHKIAMNSCLKLFPESFHNFLLQFMSQVKVKRLYFSDGLYYICSTTNIVLDRLYHTIKSTSVNVKAYDSIDRHNLEPSNNSSLKGRRSLAANFQARLDLYHGFREIEALTIKVIMERNVT